MQQHNLKAGAGLLYIRPKLSKPTFTEVSRLVKTSLGAADQLSVATLNTAGADPGWDRGHVICSKRTKEKMYVESASVTDGAGGWDTSVIRGVDGTIPLSLGVDYRIDTGGLAYRIDDATPRGIDVITFTVDDVSLNTDIVPSRAYALRRSNSVGSLERMYEHITSTATSVSVKRNYEDKDTLFVDYAIVDNDFLFICSQDFFIPEIKSNLARYWKEIEFKDTLTISPEFEVVNTDSNRRKGPNFANQLGFKVKFANVITDPEFWLQLYPNLGGNTNAAPPGIDEHEGFNADTFFGEEMIGRQMYMRGREDSLNKQFQAYFYNATPATFGDLAMGTDQRMMETEFDCTTDLLMESVGTIRQLAQC